MNKMKLIVIAAVLVLIFLGAGFWYWQNKKSKQAAASGLGSQIFEQTQNPIKNALPSNPFSNYKNPFSR